MRLGAVAAALALLLGACGSDEERASSTPAATPIATPTPTATATPPPLADGRPAPEPPPELQRAFDEPVVLAVATDEEVSCPGPDETSDGKSFVTADAYTRTSLSERGAYACNAMWTGSEWRACPGSGFESSDAEAIVVAGRRLSYCTEPPVGSRGRHVAFMWHHAPPRTRWVTHERDGYVAAFPVDDDDLVYVTIPVEALRARFSVRLAAVAEDGEVLARQVVRGVVAS